MNGEARLTLALAIFTCRHTTCTSSVIAATTYSAAWIAYSGTTYVNMHCLSLHFAVESSLSCSSTLMTH